VINFRLTLSQRIWLALVALLLVLVAQRLFAEEGVLRVCQDPNNLPFSDLQNQGFENKIAELFASKLGWKLEYYSFPQRMGFIRNTLRFKLPGEAYRCDLVMGVPAGYEQVSATRPYYRSAYALVFPEGGELAGVRTAEDFLALGTDKLKNLRIGIYDRSPASEWLVKHGLLEQGVPYRMLNADPDSNPGEIIEKDLATGKLDAAIVWGPIAGYFAKRVTEPRLRVVPLSSEEGVRLDYDIAMGVRFGEPEWKASVDRLIAENQPAINLILRDYGVPVLDAQGKVNR
jgi:mxaJ protein